MTNGNPEGNTTHNNNYSRSAIRRSVSRRSALGLLGFGAAAAALMPTLSKTAQAQNQTQNQPSQPASNQPSQIITKEIPRTKEKVPAIGLGTFMTFDALSDQPRDHLQQVMRRFWDAGGQLVDVSPLYGMSEVNVSEFARTLGLTNDLSTQRWSIRANAPTPRNSAASAVIDGKIYVVGGRKFVKNADGTTRQVNVPNLEVYDPKLDRWETRSSMPQARGGLAATSLNGKLYVFGGEQWVPEQKVFAESWVYDPKNNGWEALPPLPTARHGLGASTVGNRIFVFGGGTKTGGNAATAIHEVLVLPANLNSEKNNDD